MKSKLRLFILLFFSFLFIASVNIQNSRLLAQPEEEEEPVQARPNPMSVMQARRLIMSRLRSMGFSVRSVRKGSGNTFIIVINGWNPARVKGSYRGAISWDPGDRKGRKGRGTVIADFKRNGIFFRSGTFRSAGVRLNSAKLRGMHTVKRAQVLR